jgi:hypothetical protein
VHKLDNSQSRSVRLGKLIVRLSIGELFFSVCIAGVSLVYLFSAILRSATFFNLILIGPCAAVILVCASIHVVRAVSIARPEEEKSPYESRQGSSADATKADPRVFALMALTVLYVFAVNAVGLDIATFAFVCGSLYLLKANGVVTILITGLVTSAAVTMAVKLISTTPIPVTLVP